MSNETVTYVVGAVPTESILAGEPIRSARLADTKSAARLDGRIPVGMRIGFDDEEDTRRFHRTERGVVLVTLDMLQALETPAGSDPA